MSQNIFNKVVTFHYLGDDGTATRLDPYDCIFLGFSIDNIYKDGKIEYTETIFSMTIPLPYIDYKKATSKILEDYGVDDGLTPKEKLKKLKALCSCSAKLFIDVLKKNFMNNQEIKELIFEEIKQFLEEDTELFQEIDSYVTKNIFKKIMVNEEDKLRLSILLKEV